MFEAVDIIKKLFASGHSGKDVRHEGQYYKLESTRLWTMPEQSPPILVAASGPVTARRAGRTVDGLITEAAPVDKLGMLLQRFAEGAREAGRDPASMPKVLRLHLSWAPTDEEAMRNAVTEWPNLAMRFPKADIRSPHELEQIARMVTPADFEGRMLVSADLDAHRAQIQALADLGFDRIYLHNVGRNQREFLEVFGREVLPKVER
jgi:alkanesulfonate monooxygenase SsuD/methylene tetrahydromethanopterin reductase-like flavin-dependent oxidoreductase (luciferase family)